jgi:hypothetical protein
METLVTLLLLRGTLNLRIFFLGVVIRPFIIRPFSLSLLELRGLFSRLSARFTMVETSLEVLRDEVHIILVFSPQPFFLLAVFCYEFSRGPFLSLPL